MAIGWARSSRHAAAFVAREMLPPEYFAKLFKFGFVRNPWDHLVSAYSHFQRERQDVLRQHRVADFPQFVDFVLETPPERATRAALVRAIQRPQLEYLVGLRGEQVVDFIGRYELLESDFQEVLRRLELPLRPLPTKRRGSRPGDYRGYYSDALAERVAGHYADDLAAFQYHFDAEGRGDRIDISSGHATGAIAGRITSATESEPQEDAI